MKREAIIHIGTTKTGTTASQQALKNVRPALLSHGLHFSTTLFAPNHTAWRMMVARQRKARGLSPRATRMLADGTEARIEEFKASVRAEMEALQPEVQRVLFSDELLCMTLRGAEEIAEVRNLLQPYFDSFVIVAYLRPQSAFLASIYSERLRSRGTTKPAGIDLPRPLLKDYDYARLLGEWGEVFGESSIKPRLYKRDTDKSFSTVEDFFTMLGLTDLIPEAEPSRPINPSINVLGQEVMRQISKYLDDAGIEAPSNTPFWRDISATITKEFAGKGWQPTRQEAATFMLQFEAGNEKVRQRFFPEQETLFDDILDTYKEERTPPPSDRALFEAACATFAKSFMQLHKKQAKKAKAKP
jgi:hypothetical protein